MSTTQASTAIPQKQLTILGTNITAGYVLVGTFTAPIELSFLISTMDQAVQVSFDGINDHIAVPAGNTTPAIIPLDFKSNLIVLSQVSVFAKRIGTPTLGSLFVSGFSAIIP